MDFRKVTPDSINFLKTASVAEQAQLYVKLTKQHRAAVQNVWFNQQCKRLNVVPNYIQFRCRSTTRAARLAIDRAQKVWLNEESRHWFSIRDNLKLHLKVLYSELSFKLHNVEFDILDQKARYFASELAHKMYTTQLNKLNRLTGSSSSSFSRRGEVEPTIHHDFHPRVKNLSNVEFSGDEIGLLQKGLKYNFQSNMTPKTLENLAVDSEVAIVRGGGDLDTKTLVANVIKSTGPVVDNRSARSDALLLTSIQQKVQDNDLVVSKADKGVVFDQNTEEIQNAFKFAIMQHSTPNKTARIDFQLYVDVINTADAFKLSRLICNQFARGVIAFLGAVTPDSFDTLHSYTNTFQMPFVTPWFPEKVIPPSSGLIDYAVSMRPDYHRAVIDTITHYGWKHVIYIYDSHDGLLRLQQLYQSLQPGNATFCISNVKRVSNATDVVAFLVALERLDRWSNKYVVLDSTTQLAKEALILHVRDVHLGRRNYHYFLSGLVMDDRWEKEVTEFGAINITGFRVLDFSRKIVREFANLWQRNTISAQAALTHDAVQVLVDAIGRLLRKKPDIFKTPIRRNVNTSRILDCNPRSGHINPYEHGDKISRMIKKTEIDGLTGVVRFNEEGHRKNFSLQVMEMTVEGEMIKIATWYDNKGFIPVVPKQPGASVPGVYDRNKTYIVSTIEEPPYIMRQNSDYSEFKPNDPYKGFCVDLAKMLSDKLEIKYEIRIVKDGKYGSENPKIIGGWDGMIGEIIRKEADIAIAPLTVTVERETVVDFSKPFLSFDIKQSLKNVAKEAGTIFSFLDPLSTEVWLCLMFSVLAVTVVLFIVSRFSPYEWRVVSYTDTQSSEHTEVATTKTTVVNEFSFWNSMWFSVGSFMQQGSDITPRSVSGRIVGSVWWFFTFIVISSYTASLASYLTLQRMSEPSQAYSKVATCPEDTSEGIRSIAIPQSHNSWLSFLLDRSSPEDNANKPCEMLVTVTHSGVKDFAVALQKGSALRDGINLALQSLKDDGELQKLIRKWFTKTECHVDEEDVHATELTLGQVAGLFYVLMGGLILALGVALLEFCQHGRAEAARANVPLRAALSAKARLASRTDHKPSHGHTHSSRQMQREHERLGWNGGAYAGYYSPANQIGQEETALHASFTQV